jgi:alcohol dehydrogenase class IV
MTTNFYMPTRVIMGENCIIQNSDLFKALGNKALIVTGTQSAKKNGSQSDVITALEAVGISYLIFDEVRSNPTIACAYEGASIAKENHVDFIIAIGGGSPMDAGKAIALLAAQDIHEENLFLGNYGNKVLPTVLVPTTAGTGSEVTQYSILTNDRAQTKTSITSNLLFPRFAFLDPKYMEHLSVETTINTTIDALSHAVEGILSIRASSISNIFAFESIRMIMDCIPDILEAQKAKNEVMIDLKKREELLQASMLAGVVIAQTGTTIVHSMGYSLTYFKDVDHGRANGLLLTEFLRLVNKTKPDLIQRIIEAMKLTEIDQFGELMNQLLGQKEEVTPEEIQEYSKIAMSAKNRLNSVVRPSEKEIGEMFSKSLS